MLRLFEIALVVVAAGQLVRIGLKPPFRRDMVALPHLALAGGGVAILTGMAAVAVVLRWPVALHVAAVVSLAGWAMAWWRARPSYGQARHWPPGSLGINASLDAIDDRDYYGNQARLHGPVFKMSQFGRPVLCVVGLTHIRDLLHSHPEALAGASLPYNRFVPKGSLRYMSGDDHKQEGPLFRNAFSTLELEPNEDAVRAACRTMLSTLAEDSRHADGGVRAREYISQWVLRSLAKVFFGIEPSDPRVLELERAHRALVLDRSGGRAWRRQMEGAFVSATDILRNKVREDLANGREISSGSALGALLAADPTALDNETRIRNLFFIFRLGVGDATALLDWVLYELTEHPEWQVTVRAALRATGAPKGAQPSDIGARVVLETVRMEQSEFLYRRIVRPIAFEGYTIPAGWLLRLCIAESHRDPAIFPNPDRFDPDRFIGRAFGRSEFSPFGADGHGCLGVPLVHFLGRILVEELCHGYSWRVVRDGPLERGTRHRHHWRPSAKRQIVVTPLGSEHHADAFGR
ncbi:MAG: cytochrome P450 [Gemmatimonadaceae bacterium]|nr:cytochrome P450 [Gemmatimonadaceae bacterium]